MSAGTVIVGASLAGIRTALDLRKEGYEGAVTLIGDEPTNPYDRPPLSKGFLSGKNPVESLSLCPDDYIDDQGIDLRTGTAAESVDLDRNTVKLTNGDSVSYANLVVATGARCIRPAWYRAMTGAHELRTLADAHSLQATLRQASSLVVIGGGFVGSEVAATARSMGLHVTLVLREAAPLGPVLGEQVSAAIKVLHESHGVAVRPFSDVEALVGEQSVEGVRLSDGTVIAADAVLVAVGVKPQVDWLVGTDLYDPRGVKVDNRGRAGNAVWAAGDVVQQSKGHWATAITHAKAVAADITGKPATSLTLPDYFWSDQYTHKLQVLGHVGPDMTFSPIVGSLEEMNFVGVYATNDQITGALLIDQPKNLGRMRQLVGLGASVDTCREKIA